MTTYIVTGPGTEPIVLRLEGCAHLAAVLLSKRGDTTITASDGRCWHFEHDREARDDNQDS